MTADELAIGIDLGTTNSCVAVYQPHKEKPETINNWDYGERITASCVQFCDGTVTVGKSAKEEAPYFPKQTICQAKRLIGRTFDDPYVTDIVRKKKVLFDIETHNKKIEIRVGDRTYSPEDVSCEVLRYLKESAEKYLCREITKAVITVPAGFDPAQIAATESAANKAGLEVLDMLKEPTAAAFSYGFEQREEKTILVFDFGGGTLDVTILQVLQGYGFRTLSSECDQWLGGEDYDDILADYILEQFCQKNKLDFSKLDRSTLGKARLAATDTKHRLSIHDAVKVFKPKFYLGLNLEMMIDRATFDRLTKNVNSQLMNPVRRALDEANLEPSDIDDVVLVGGSSKLPQVQKALRAIFETAIIKCHVPEEAIAHGAALQAYSLLHENDAAKGPMIKNSAINSTTLGIECKIGDVEDCYDIIIKKGTPIPCEVVKQFYTTCDYQTFIIFRIYQGENTSKASENHFLGVCTVDGFPPEKKGKQIFDVKMTLDKSNRIHVYAMERESKKDAACTITFRK